MVRDNSLDGKQTSDSTHKATTNLLHCCAVVLCYYVVACVCVWHCCDLFCRRVVKSIVSSFRCLWHCACKLLCNSLEGVREIIPCMPTLLTTWLSGKGGRLGNQSSWLAWARIPARSDMCSTPLPSRSLWAALGQLGKAEN